MNPFKDLDVKSGLGVAFDKNANTFWILNYISQAVVSKKPVIFISSRYSSVTYRICCSKMIVRWDPALIKFVELTELMENNMTIDLPALIKRIEETIETTGADQIIFDDCSVFERLGISSADTIYSILELYDSLPNNGVLFAQFAVETKACKILQNKADFSLSYETVGLGFGKNVTGKVIISTRGGALTTERKEFLYHTGDRGVKFFYPGNVPLDV